MHVHEMISAHPEVRGSTNDVLIRAIETCCDCAAACVACADACLGEETVRDLTQCIRLNLDCADVCAATSVVATRRTGSNEQVIQHLLEVCGAAARVCGEECDRHAGRHEHCRICADTCAHTAHACREAIQSLSQH